MNHTTATIQTNTPVASMEFTSFRPIILSIDGNIGSGKSTLYKDLQSHYKNNADICFVPEPVDDWTHIVDGDNVPILTNLYKDTKITLYISFKNNSLRNPFLCVLSLYLVEFS